MALHWGDVHCGVLESLDQHLDALLIAHLAQVDGLGRIDIHQDVPVAVVVVSSLVPDRVDHEDVLSWLQDDFRVEQREVESAAKSSLDELTLISHENDVEGRLLEDLARGLLAVVLETLTLLEDGDGESVLVEVDLTGNRELEESLGEWALVLTAKGVVQLGVHVLGGVVLDTDGSPGEVLKVVL